MSTPIMLNSDIILISFLVLLNCMSCIFCVLSPNPMVSLLFLILIFFNVSLMFMLLGLEFLSLLILLVYVGAISVLFIFVLMMLDIKVLILKSFICYKSLIIYVSFMLFLLLIALQLGLNFYMLFYYNDQIFYTVWTETFFELSDLEAIGYTIFNKYVIHFILITVLLFVVLIASISIVKKTEDYQNFLNLKKKQSVTNIYYTENFQNRSLNFDFNNKIKEIEKFN